MFFLRCFLKDKNLATKSSERDCSFSEILGKATVLPNFSRSEKYGILEESGPEIGPRTINEFFDPKKGPFSKGNDSSSNHSCFMPIGSMGLVHGSYEMGYVSFRGAITFLAKKNSPTCHPLFFQECSGISSRRSLIDVGLRLSFKPLLGHDKLYIVVFASIEIYA